MGRRRQPFRHLTRLPVTAIAPGPPAADYDDGTRAEAVSRLAQTLRRQGQREPVLVTVAAAVGNGAGAGAARGASSAGDGTGTPPYALVLGRNRLAAARQLRWKELDAVLLDDSFAAELAVIRRLQADDWEPWELAGTVRRLQERCGWTQAQVGTVIGRNRDFVAGLAAILEIAPDVRAYLAQHPQGRGLSVRHLRYIGRARPTRQLAMAREILEQGLTTKLLEQRSRDPARARRYIKVRELARPGRSRNPTTTREWRRYYRKLSTDLRRVEEQETRELRRTGEVIATAQQRQRLIRREARAKRQELAREIRRAARQLTRRGAL